MKILYIANDRRAAQDAAFVLRAAVPQVTVAWAAAAGDARGWIDRNRDVALIVEDTGSPHPDGQPLVAHLHGLGLTVPVIAVSTDPSCSQAAANAFLIKDSLFLANLPQVVKRLIAAEGAPGAPRRRLRLLYAGDDALARECFGRSGGSIDVVRAAAGPDERLGSVAAYVEAAGEPAVDVVFVEHGDPSVDALAILKEAQARQTGIPIVLVADWDEKLAVAALKLGASDYVIKSRASFRAVYFRLNRLIAHAALAQAQSKERAATAATADQERSDRKALLERLSDAHSARDHAERRLTDALAAIKQARQERLADAVAAAEEQARVERDFAGKLAESAARASKLERQLADRDAALRLAIQRSKTDLQNAIRDFSRRQAELETAVAAEVTERRTLETKLAYADMSLQAAEQRRLAETASAAERFAQQHEELTSQVAQIARERDALEERLNQAIADMARSQRERAADAAEAANRLAEREAALLARLGSAAAAQERLERRLADADTALRCAEQRVEAEQIAARQLATERQAAFQAELSHQAASREQLKEQLAGVMAAVRASEERRTLDSTVADATLSALRIEHEARLSEAASAYDNLRGTLASVEDSLRAAVEQHALEAEQAAARLAAIRQEAAARAAESASALEALERKLADATEAAARAEAQAAAERRVASEAAAAREAQFDAERSRQILERQRLEAAITASEADRLTARQQHEAALSAAAARLAEHQQQTDAWLLEAAAFANALEEKWTAAEAALARAEADAASERQQAADGAAARHAAFDAALAEATARERAIAEEISNLRLASEQARVRFADEVAELRRTAHERETRLGEAAAEERAAAARAEAELQERLAQLQAEASAARGGFAAAEAQVKTLESDRARLGEELDALRALLDRTQTAARETVERAAADHSIERARLEAVVAERDAQLIEQSAHARASELAAAAAFSDLERRFEALLGERTRDADALANLRTELERSNREIAALGRQRETLQATADRVPQLESQVDAARRRFEGSPIATCRCAADGSITDVNRALARLLGYGTTDDARRLDFAGRVFESRDELRWIVDRALASGSMEAVETTWRKKDGSRLVVRVLAVPLGAESVEIVAEDITRVRVLEEKLRNSQRMEAVARYGSEVAVTCHSLLRHVKQEGQQWLARLESDTTRYQGELLLDDVTRAAGFLGQLAAYGSQQRNAPDLVDVNKVLRDLGPVLKRVAGDDIDVVLPQASTPLNLDVEAGRVERILVNVAAYGRGRMPHGGRLIIEVAGVFVDRTFVAKYPNVRPGAHVLLTVNEVRGEARPYPASMPVDPRAAGAADNPGVELGTLQALVHDCGGHLWMMAEPSGNMVLKIHLPRRVLDRLEPRVAAFPSRRPNWIHRTFGARH